MPEPEAKPSGPITLQEVDDAIRRVLATQSYELHSKDGTQVVEYPDLGALVELRRDLTGKPGSRPITG